MNKKNFIKRVEDFTCANCGKLNKSLPSGTRNHCQYCLHSLHVDRDLPGDRTSTCHGIMKPINGEQKHGSWIIVQQCQKCGHIWRNKLTPEDNFEILIKTIETYAENNREN